MSRMLLVAGLSLLSAASSLANEPSANEESQNPIASPGTLIAFSHDPNCPGCRAFLTGYSHDGSCSCAHSPGCSACDGAGGTGGVGGGAGPTSDDMVLGEDLLASDYGYGFGFDNAAPGMIGDFFGAGFQMNVVTAGQPTGEFTNISQAGGDRRFKIAENYSPFPIDRVFVNYNHFHHALRTADGRDANLNRMTMGLEKTFFDGMWSAEVRAPFSTGLAADQYVVPNFNNVSGEFGNVAVALKVLLSQTDTLAVSTGLGMVFPTGSDTRLFDSTSTHHLTISNDAFYLQPFVGAWWTPNDRLFGQFAVQADFDTTGNQIDYVRDAIGPVATIQDQALLFLDASFGYWLFHDPSSDAVVTGLAPMIELHHNTTLEDSESVVVGPGINAGSFGGVDTYTNPSNRLDVLNLTGAVRMELAGISYLTIFGVTPLREGDDKLFDSEFGVQYSRLY
jgi:hypothetical protein